MEMPCAKSSGTSRAAPGARRELTRDLRLDARLLAAAEELGLDGFHHTLEAPAGT